MKSFSLTLIAASAIGLIATPLSARTGEVVNFTYRAHELTSTQGQEGLLTRMRATALAACAGSLSRAYATENDCRTDLETQFIEAIDNPALVARYENRPLMVARNGS